MSTPLQEVQSRLEAQGLHVSADEQSLFIAGSLVNVGADICLSSDACVLLQHADRWVVIFPAEGICTYEVDGPLPEMVSLIEHVYQHHRDTGGGLTDAVKQVLPNAAQYRRGEARAAGKANGAPLVPTNGGTANQTLDQAGKSSRG